MWTKREMILNILVIVVAGKLKIGIKAILLIMNMKDTLKQLRYLIDFVKKLKR